jgi:radical SAM protein with 4Fe4S-binding SPASM domain
MDITAWLVTTHDSKVPGSSFDLPVTKEVIYKCKVLALSKEIRFLGKLKRLLANEGGNKGCKIPWTSCFITWDGFVYPCCHLLYISKDFCFGNVFDASFKEIWYSEEYSRFRLDFVNNPPDICKRCGWW